MDSQRPVPRSLKGIHLVPPDPPAELDGFSRNRRALASATTAHSGWRIAAYVFGVLLFGSLMATRYEVHGAVYRALIAGVAFAVLAAVRSVFRDKRHKPTSRSARP